MSNTENSTITILKLNNGDEIIARVQDVEQGVIAVEDPIQIAIMPSPDDGRVSMGLIPYMAYSKSIVMYTNNVIAFAVPNEDLLERYNRFFSKLVVPSSKIDLSATK